MDHWVISSEIGWRKPSPTFYEHLVEVVGLPAQSILLVGDDPINDLEAPKMAGMQGMLVKGPDCLHTLVNRLGKSPSAGTKVPAG
jgi:putative hydrolase of the HAD superfamily